MLPKLREIVHIIQKAKNEGRNYSANMDRAIKIYQDNKNSLSEKEREWIDDVLFDKTQDSANIDTCDSEVIKTIRSRRSVRSYINKPIENKSIMKILDGAKYAPSSCNRQPLEYIIVRDKNSIQLLKKYKRQVFIGDSDVCILVLVDLKAYRQDSQQYFAYLDSGAAIQNMLLVATEMGIGSCWVNTVSHDTNLNSIYSYFKIEPDYLLASIITFGYSEKITKMPGRKDLTVWKEKFGKREDIK